MISAVLNLQRCVVLEGKGQCAHIPQYYSDPALVFGVSSKATQLAEQLSRWGVPRAVCIWLKGHLGCKLMSL